MPLLKLQDFHLHYGEQIIFDQLEFQLDKGDRVCIIGRNGVGKSTLLKALEKKLDADSGNYWCDSGVTIASLSQDLPEACDISVYNFVASGLAPVVSAIEEFEALAREAGPEDMKRMEILQHIIESADGWNLDNRITQVLTRLDLDGDANLNDMSGGWRRRVSLAKALVVQPDILLLDEPTNHLDIGAIQWLEQQLLAFRGAIVFITHDRAFLRVVANKIGELDRGILTLWDGNYDGFLVHKEHLLETEARHNALFDKKLAQEEVWIRQGIKARRTRNEGRVRALKKMRDERSQRRETQSKAKIEHGFDVPSGKLVAELKGVSLAWGDKKVIDDFSCTIVRGDKIGLIGPNGIGKSTLLKVILGENEPNAGSVKMGTKLTVAYFDQLRDQLDLEKNAIDNIAEGRDSVDINGRSRHIISYLQDFLFSGERARTPIKALSGGERNRVLLAKMFSKPSNLLVMDEPTNDLDAETLELLEDLLVEFEGTLLLVSHDRAFLDNVVTSSIAFEGHGQLQEYVGGYSDWIHQGGVWPEDKPINRAAKPLAAADDFVSTDPQPSQNVATKKLSYKLQRELDDLPARLDKQEQLISALQEHIGADGFFSGDQDLVHAKLNELSDAEAQLQQLFERWEALESMQG